MNKLGLSREFRPTVGGEQTDLSLVLSLSFKEMNWLIYKFEGYIKSANWEGVADALLDEEFLSGRLPDDMSHDEVINMYGYARYQGSRPLNRFKFLVFSRGSEDVMTFCGEMAAELNVEEDGLGDALLDGEDDMFYCFDRDVADRFGFMGVEEFRGDIERLANVRGMDFGEAERAYFAVGGIDEDDLEGFLFISGGAVNEQIIKDRRERFDAALHDLRMSQNYFSSLVGMTPQGVIKWKKSGTYPAWVNYALKGMAKDRDELVNEIFGLFDSFADSEIMNGCAVEWRGQTICTDGFVQWWEDSDHGMVQDFSCVFWHFIKSEIDYQGLCWDEARWLG
ncbi:hypothetical protein ACP3V3_16955 [Vibrio sp. PNB22_3_1]